MNWFGENRLELGLGLGTLEDVVELHGQHDLSLDLELAAHVSLLTCILHVPTSI